MPIVRYTTPTLKYAFKDVNVGNIMSAFLVIKQGNKKVIERDISTATVVNTQADKSISWTLTQEETKRLSKGKVYVYCDWKLNDGTRGVAKLFTDTVEDSGKQEII